MIRTEKTRSRLDFLNIAVGQRRCSSLRAASLFPNMNDLWDFVMVNLKIFLDKAVWNIYVFSWPLQKLTDLGWEWKSITRCRMWRCEAESCCRKWKLFYTLKRGDRWYKNPYKHMQTKSIWKRQRKCKRKKNLKKKQTQKNPTKSKNPVTMMYTAVCGSLDIYKEGILGTTSLQQLGKESRNGYFVFKDPYP